ncbi:Kelch domain-containing protein 10 [Diplonema papillatum]|nr:Kelch domain-containing protein 10 [Diplonema papillatum]
MEGIASLKHTLAVLEQEDAEYEMTKQRRLGHWNEAKLIRERIVHSSDIVQVPDLRFHPRHVDKDQMGSHLRVSTEAWKQIEKSLRHFDLDITRKEALVTFNDDVHEMYTLLLDVALLLMRETIYSNPLRSPLSVAPRAFKAPSSHPPFFHLEKQGLWFRPLRMYVTVLSLIDPPMTNITKKEWDSGIVLKLTPIATEESGAVSEGVEVQLFGPHPQSNTLMPHAGFTAILHFEENLVYQEVKDASRPCVSKRPVSVSSSPSQWEVTSKREVRISLKISCRKMREPLELTIKAPTVCDFKAQPTKHVLKGEDGLELILLTQGDYDWWRDWRRFLRERHRERSERREARAMWIRDKESREVQEEVEMAYHDINTAPFGPPAPYRPIIPDHFAVSHRVPVHLSLSTVPAAPGHFSVFSIQHFRNGVRQCGNDTPVVNSGPPFQRHTAAHRRGRTSFSAKAQCPAEKNSVPAVRYGPSEALSNCRLPTRSSTKRIRACSDSICEGRRTRQRARISATPQAHPKLKRDGGTGGDDPDPDDHRNTANCTETNHGCPAPELGIELLKIGAAQCLTRMSYRRSSGHRSWNSSDSCEGVVLCGGVLADTREVSRDFLYVNCLTGAVHPLPRAPFRREKFTLVEYDSHYYAYGGFGQVDGDDAHRPPNNKPFRVPSHPPQRGTSRPSAPPARASRSARLMSFKNPNSVPCQQQRPPGTHHLRDTSAGGHPADCAPRSPKSTPTWSGTKRAWARVYAAPGTNMRRGLPGTGAREAGFEASSTPAKSDTSKEMCSDLDNTEAAATQLYSSDGPAAAGMFHTVVEYSCARGTWTEVPTTFEKGQQGHRAGHTAVVRGSLMVVFGGWAVSDDMEVPRRTNSVEALQLKSGKWRTIDIAGEKPVPRSDHSAVVYQSGMYVYGGLGPIMAGESEAAGNCPPMKARDADSDGETNSAGSMTAWEHHRRVHANDDQPTGPLGDLWCLQLAKRTRGHWTLMVPRTSVYPPPMAQHSVCAFANTLFLCGGSSESRSPCIYQWSFTTSSWRTVDCPADVSSATLKRAGHAFIVYETPRAVEGSDSPSRSQSPKKPHKMRDLTCPTHVCLLGGRHCAKSTFDHASSSFSPPGCSHSLPSSGCLPGNITYDTICGASGGSGKGVALPPCIFSLQLVSHWTEQLDEEVDMFDAVYPVGIDWREHPSNTRLLARLGSGRSRAPGKGCELPLLSFGSESSDSPSYAARASSWRHSSRARSPGPACGPVPRAFIRQKARSRSRRRHQDTKHVSKVNTSNSKRSVEHWHASAMQPD